MLLPDVLLLPILVLILTYEVKESRVKSLVSLVV